jgi:hypothetical protein
MSKLSVLKNVGEKGAMSAPRIITLEALFILIFGIFHFAVPFILPPNYANTGFIAGLQVADFVIPGCFTLAIISIIVFITKNRYAAVALSFLYGGGVVFHGLYLSGALPPSNNSSKQTASCSRNHNRCTSNSDNLSILFPFSLNCSLSPC